MNDLVNEALLLNDEHLPRARREACARRIVALRAQLAENHLDACYVRDLSNIKWLSAFDGVFDDEPAHALLITPGKVLLHSDSRYGEALAVAAQDTPVEIDLMSGPHAKFLLDALPAPARVAVEDTLSLREFHALEDAAKESPCSVEFVERRGFIETLRQSKDALEVELACRAQAITDAAFAYIVGIIRPGMTEAQIQRALDAYMLEQGASGLAFPTIVAAGAHAASPHAIAGERIVQAGDAVVMDFGARFGGYCSDMTRTVFIGEPDEKLQKAWAALQEANETCASAIRAGKTGAEMHALAESVLSAHGFAGRMGHGLGHSLGIDIHEDPALAPRNTEGLPAGALVTVEPGIYVPGEFGMRLEDFGLVTETGFDVITQSGHDMVIIEPPSR